MLMKFHHTWMSSGSGLGRQEMKLCVAFSKTILTFILFSSSSSHFSLSFNLFSFHCIDHVSTPLCASCDFSSAAHVPVVQPTERVRSGDDQNNLDSHTH